MTHGSSYLRQEPRSLPIALAHRFAAPFPFRDPPRMELLNRMYESLTVGDKMRCTAEFRECRAAKRGARLAELV